MKLKVDWTYPQALVSWLVLASGLVPCALCSGVAWLVGAL